MTTDPTRLPALLGAQQVADALGITRRAVLFRIYAGTLEANKLGEGRAAWVITREALIKAMAADVAKAHHKNTRRAS